MRENALREEVCTKMLHRSKRITDRALTAAATELESIIIETGATSPKSIEQAGLESEK